MKIKLFILIVAFCMFFSGLILGNHVGYSDAENEHIEEIKLINTVIDKAYQKEEGNVYTDKISIKNDELYIPIRYKGLEITLIAGNFSEYNTQNMSALYEYLDNKYNRDDYTTVGTTSYPVSVGGTDKMGNRFYVLDKDALSPFSTHYVGNRNIPTNQCVELINL